MNHLIKEIRHNPLSAALAAGLRACGVRSQKLKPEAHTLLFVLSVLPLAAPLSHATESVVFIRLAMA